MRLSSGIGRSSSGWHSDGRDPLPGSPDFATKAAVLTVHLVKNHALPDGNKRVEFLALVEFCERNGYSWAGPVDDEPDGDETVRTILAVATGEIDVPRLTEWVSNRLARPRP